MKKKLFSSILFLVLFFALSTACFAFDDVPLDHPWADGIFYLEQTGIVKGNGEGQFLPAEHITTEQWAKSAVPPGTRRSPTHIKTPATNPTSVRSGNVSSSGPAGKEKPSAAAYGASAYGTEAVHTLNTHKETGGSPAGVSPSGSSPSSTPQMQGARLSPLQSAPSKGQPPSKPESAGINPVSPVSRFTQATAQRVHNGPVQSKIQSAAKTGIQVGQRITVSSRSWRCSRSTFI